MYLANSANSQLAYKKANLACRFEDRFLNPLMGVWSSPILERLRGSGKERKFARCKYAVSRLIEFIIFCRAKPTLESYIAHLYGSIIAYIFEKEAILLRQMLLQLASI